MSAGMTVGIVECLSASCGNGGPPVAGGGGTDGDRGRDCPTACPAAAALACDCPPRPSVPPKNVAWAGIGGLPGPGETSEKWWGTDCGRWMDSALSSQRRAA